MSKTTTMVIFLFVISCCSLAQSWFLSDAIDRADAVRAELDVCRVTAKKVWEVSHHTSVELRDCEAMLLTCTSTSTI